MNLEQNFFDTTEIFKDLNPEQQKAVNHLDGPLLIMAGAGSGKTRVLTCRIANLIAQGISPYKILAITFTNKAANEMKSRAENLIGAPAKNIILSTFHSFCARLLRREIEVTGKFSKNFTICDAGDSKALLKQCISDLRLDENFFAHVSFKISDFKNNLIDPAHCLDIPFTRNIEYASGVKEIYTRYQKKLAENNSLDFDDLIFFTVKIFREHPEILDKYQERFQYISVDEYQDTNVAQYVLTKLLAAKYKNLCVVGDADQSIYGWRGADMRNILNFEWDYPQARVIKLEQNYRSTKIILTAANSVIRNNFDRKPKNLWTQNEGGEKIKFFHCTDDRMEAAVVAREIERLVVYENFSYKDIALLYRTNAQSRIFEETFMQRSIPYIIVGGLKFYDRKEIKDIVAYLHVIANPHDNVHLMRIINTPRRGLGATNLNRLSEFADSQGLSVLELVADNKLLGQVDGLTPRFRASLKNFAAMMLSFTACAENLSVDKLIKVVLDESGYLEMIRTDKDNGKTDSISREENLGAFIDSAKEFAVLHPDETLEDFLNHVALITDIDTVDDKESRVKLMTVHAAKGLEFPAVFVVGMEENLFPHANSLENTAALEEERRACYVALTRAEKKLYLSAARSRMFFGKIRDQEVSRFIHEIPAACLSGNLSAAPAKKFPPPKNFSYRPPTAHRPAQVSPAKKSFAPSVAWHVGDQLNHKKFGAGVVTEVKGQVITVAFANPEAGVKKLSSNAAPINKL